MKACVLISHFRAKAEMRRNADLEDRPAVIVDRSNQRPLVVDSSTEASGVKAGMTLEQAMSHHANTIVLESDEPYYSKVFDQVLKSLQGVSDRVEKSELGVAYVALNGLETMYDGEANLVRAIINAVPANLNPRVGVSDSKFAAFVAARTSRSGGASKVSSDIAGFLAHFSLNLLPISQDAKIRLHRFGMDVMGDIASLKIEFLVDQFGTEGKLIWELCNGIDNNSIVPIKYEESVLEHMSLPFYSTSTEVLQVAVDTLLKRAYTKPQMRGKYAAKALLRCATYNSSDWVKAINFKQGIGSWDRASFVIKSHLEVDPPQAPIEDASLTLSDFTNEIGSQIALLENARDDKKRELVEVNQRLRAKMNGSHALYKVAEVAPWHPVPEMRALQVPIDPSGNEAVKSLYLPVPVSVQESKSGMPQNLRLGKRWHKVIRIEDLWTFDLWWLPKPIERTYFQVTRDDGRQVTLFRDQQDKCWYQQSY